MPQIDVATRTLTLKLVYYGPGFSGKTTNLEYVYEQVPKEARGELTSIATHGDRTIFYDFLPVDMGAVSGLSVRLKLYTVPGQSYYQATRKLVLVGVDGLVFVADSQRDRLEESVDCLAELGEQLAAQSRRLEEQIPLVFQWNKRDLPNLASPALLDKRLNRFGAPSFEAIATRGDGVMTTLRTLAVRVVDKVRREHGSSSAARSASGSGARPRPPRKRPPPRKGPPRRPAPGRPESRRRPAPRRKGPPRPPGRRPRPSPATAGSAAPPPTTGAPPGRPSGRRGPPRPKRPSHPILGPQDEVGEKVGGCVILAKLGEGAMGTVYLARHEDLGKTVVVKTLKPDRAASEKDVKRFFREAHSAAKLAHQNIVQVEEVGTDEQGMHYMIMQHVGGLNLRQMVERRGPMESFEAARIMLEVAKALDATHRADVIHRDVKPQNVVVSSKGEVKLIDFGLAKDLYHEHELTRTGAMVGTIAYMAPEIAKGEEVDQRCDIYSLGLTFYYLLTSVTPFLDQNPQDVIMCRAQLRPPWSFVSDLPPRLRVVLERMLALDPEDRYPNAAILAADLESLWDPKADAGAPARDFWLWDLSDDTDPEAPALDPAASDPPSTRILERREEPKRPKRKKAPRPAPAGEPNAFGAEVLSALEAWESLEERDLAAETGDIARLIEDAWEPDVARPPGAADERPVELRADGAPARPEGPLLASAWRDDLQGALAEIEAAPLEDHQRARLSRDPGQAEVNALLRRGPAGVRRARPGTRTHRRATDRLDELDRAVEANEGHPQPWTKRGIAKARAGDLDGSIADYTRALELQADFLPALVNRGSARFHLNQFEGAEDDCGRALELAPRLAKAWLFRGLSRVMLGQGESAKEDLLRFLRLSPYSPYVGYIRTLLKKFEGSRDGSRPAASQS